jgi:4-methyl-5(b-hydroxyethyl)-thiazole monophosphate biosynthesis
MKKACMIVDDGFEELELVGAYDILVRAGVSVDIFTLKSAPKAAGKCGLHLADLRPLDQLRTAHYDALVLAGGPHYAALKNSARVKEIILDFYNAGKVIGAICASPTILGEMGLLKGKNYTCFTSMNADFGGHFTGDYATTDGKLVTGKSAAAAVDFGLALVEAVCGKEIVHQVKESIYY